MERSFKLRFKDPARACIRPSASGGSILNSPFLILFPALIAMVFFLGSVDQGFATADFADETGQECSVCHISASGGGGLTEAGESYLKDPENWKAPARKGPGTAIYKRLIHAVVLYAHVFFGIIWIGTILYVHLVLKPEYALGGLPRSELRLAWISMPMLGLTGILLTFWRLQLSPGLLSTLFGKLLILKIVVFLLMVSSATFVTLYVGPRLRELAISHHASADLSGKDRFTLDELEGFDGIEGNKALVAANDKVYDVSSSHMWKGGVHVRRHKAGHDLTEYLDDAPHGPEVLDRCEIVGDLVKESVQAPTVVRAFKVNAYFNLIGCFLIILILVLWRW